MPKHILTILTILTLTLFMARNPNVIKLAQADDLSAESKMALEQCNSDPMAKGNYSCQCVAEGIEAYLGPTVDKSAQKWEAQITQLQKSITKNNNNSKLTKEKAAKINKVLLTHVEKAQTEINKLRDRSYWNDATRTKMIKTALQDSYKDPTCKIPDNIQQMEYTACLKSPAGQNPKGKTPEAYCTCSADKAAEFWLASTQAYSSSMAASAAMKGRSSCLK